MGQLESSVEKAKVFISYSRSDSSGLAEELLAGLELAGFDAYLDKHDIEKGEDWEERLMGLITKADSVIFIISPASVKSPRCGWEVDRAVELGKRIIPVHWIHVPESDVPVRLKRLNYTFFAPGQSFAQPLADLARVLRQDLDWIRMHTLILEQAVRWKARGIDAEDLLLRGSELTEATAWRQRRKNDAPTITDLQRAFLEASEIAERQRLKRSRRLKATLVGLAAALAVGSFAWWQGQWVKEKYFQMTYVQGQLNPASSLSRSSPPFRDCKVCPEMVVLPMGSFRMGAPEGEGNTTEQPQHPVTLERAIAIGQLEVTFEEWDQCVTFGDCAADISANSWGRGQQPVINISWHDAGQYVSWLSRVTGLAYRLPSEAEWEYAARARSETLYSFGNEDETHLPSHGWFAGNASRRAQPVGQKKPNPFKLHDMHGNVKEWVLDCWKENYQTAPADGSAYVQGNCSRRVVRGGSWLSRPKALRSSSREWVPVDRRSDEVGMRVVRDLTH